MSYLVRKIARSKWTDCDTDISQPLSSDAVTNCLKTTGNTLSVWFAENETDIEQAKLALLAGLERFDAVDIIILEANEIMDIELPLQETDGETRAKGLVKLHRDIGVKTVDELKKAAKLVQGKIVGNSVTRIMKGQFKDIILQAVVEKIIKREDLSSSMAKELSSSLASPTSV